METLHQEHSGTGDNIGRDKIVHIYQSAADYKELEKQFSDLQLKKEKLQTRIQKYPDDKDFRIELLEVNEAIDDLVAKIGSFKSNVNRLYQTFNKIEINTQRLNLAKAHFDKGEFREADAMLKAEEMSDDLIKVKEQQKKGEQIVKQAKEKREQFANEFKIKAQLWQTFYTESDWFKRTIEFYEKALGASALVEIICEYAMFLEKHNQFNQADDLLKKALKIYRDLAQENPQKYLPDLATTLFHLSGIQHILMEIPKAYENCKEALKIRRELAEENPQKHLPDVARALNNLALLNNRRMEWSKGQEHYQEALKIFSKLTKETKKKKHLPIIAEILGNLANRQVFENELPEAIEKHEQSLKIFKELAKENPKKYLPEVGISLSMLAKAQKAKGDLPKAIANWEVALKIYRECARENPKAYLRDVANILNNISNFYEAINKLPMALKNCEEALKIFKELAEENPQEYLSYVASTLKELGILQISNNKFQQAFANYDEALDIYRKLAEENPQTHEMGYAGMLVFGVADFMRDKNILKEARLILNNYPNIVPAPQLLDMIDILEKNK